MSATKCRMQYIATRMSPVWHHTDRNGERTTVTYSQGSTKKKIPTSHYPFSRPIQGRVYSFIMHGCSCTTVDPRIPTMPKRSTSDFHAPGRHCSRREVLDESHEGQTASYQELLLLRRIFWHIWMTAVIELIYFLVRPFPEAATGVLCN